MLNLKKNNVTPLIFNQIFIIFILIINALCAAAFPGGLWSFFALGLYIYLLTSIYRLNPLVLLIFSPILVVQATALLSIGVIETGAHMKEMGRIGYASSSGAAFALLISIFLFVASLFLGKDNAPGKINFTQNNVTSTSFMHAMAAPIGVGLCVLWLLLKGMSTGFPLIEGVDRFFYRQNFADPITLNLLNLKIVVAAFVGLSCSNCASSRWKSFHHSVFSAYICASFLFADKFFGIIVSCLMYFAMLVGSRPQDIKNLFGRLALPSIVVLFFALVVTGYIYSGQGAYGFDETIALMLDRFASQGQLWFIAYNENFRWFAFEADDVFSNLKSLLSVPHQDYVFDHGLSAFHFVFTYAPTEMVYSFARNEGFVAPTGVFEAYMIELFGIFGAFFISVLAGILLGFIGRFMRYSMSLRNPFLILLPSYILVQFYYLIVSGTPYNLFGISAFKAYAAILLLSGVMFFWSKIVAQYAPRVSSSNAQ